MKKHLIELAICSLCLSASCDKTEAAPPAEVAQLSDATRRDIQDIFIAADRLLSLGEDAVQSRKTLEYDIKVFNINADGNSNLLKQGIIPPKNMSDNVDAALAKCEADRKLFKDAISRYVEVQATAKAKIDFLNIPGSPSIKSAMQETSKAWATFRSTAEAGEQGGAAESAEIADRLEQLKNSAATLFEKAKVTINQQFPPNQ
jgi:hypothetical protein